MNEIEQVEKLLSRMTPGEKAQLLQRVARDLGDARPGVDEIAEESLAGGCSGVEHDEFGFGVGAVAFHGVGDPAVVSRRDDLPHAGFAFFERAGSFASAYRCGPGGPFVRVGWRVVVDW